MSESAHIVCPHCAAVNRIPTGKLHAHPNCGKCHQALFQAVPVILDEAGFNRHLQRNDIPVLVDFWASWCQPCRMMAPAYEQAAARLEPQVRVVKVNTEQAQALSQSLGIRSIPTLALFRGGREIARQAGAMDTAAIVRWVQAQL